MLVSMVLHGVYKGRIHRIIELPVLKLVVGGTKINVHMEYHDHHIILVSKPFSHLPHLALSGSRSASSKFD